MDLLNPNAGRTQIYMHQIKDENNIRKAFINRGDNWEKENSNWPTQPTAPVTIRSFKCCVLFCFGNPFSCVFVHFTSCSCVFLLVWLFAPPLRVPPVPHYLHLSYIFKCVFPLFPCLLSCGSVHCFDSGLPLFHISLFHPCWNINKHQETESILHFGSKSLLYLPPCLM